MLHFSFCCDQFILKPKLSFGENSKTFFLLFTLRHALATTLSTFYYCCNVVRIKRFTVSTSIYSPLPGWPEPPNAGATFRASSDDLSCDVFSCDVCSAVDCAVCSLPLPTELFWSICKRLPRPPPSPDDDVIGLTSSDCWLTNNAKKKKNALSVDHSQSHIRNNNCVKRNFFGAIRDFFVVLTAICNNRPRPPMVFGSSLGFVMPLSSDDFCAADISRAKRPTGLLPSESWLLILEKFQRFFPENTFFQ